MRILLSSLAYLCRGDFLFKLKIKYSFIILATVSILFWDLRLIICAVIGMALHEAAHIICAKIYEYDIKSLELSAQGLTIDFNDNPTGYKNLLILMSGPMMNLTVSAILFLWHGNHLQSPATFNLSFGLFNLLPMRFLDGGRILEEILECVFPLNISVRICKYVNTFLLCVTWCFSIYCFLFESTHSSSMFFCVFALINLCLDDSF